MMYGIRYRGRHSSELGIICKTKKRPAIAPVRTVEETVPYRDGSLDYSTRGGRLFYDDKLLEIEFIIPESELRMTQRKVNDVIKWLAGDFDDLIFDDMLTTKWKARPIDLSEVAIELFRVGKVTVQFRCAPFNTLLFSSARLILDTDVPIDADVTLDFGIDSEISFEANTIKEVTYSCLGDVPVRPDIKVDADTTEIGIEVNEEMFTVTTPKSFSEYGGIVIDCENWKCVGNDGTDITAYTEGDYPELVPGENKIIVLSADAGGTLSLDFHAQYYYGGDFY